MPDAYERTLREIFPTVRKGSFTWREDIYKWVWTTFNSFQWDLNYANPAVFRAMTEEMLFIANSGIEILEARCSRFHLETYWHQLQRRPTTKKAHQMRRRHLTPSHASPHPRLLFKSAAIVHPDDVVGCIRRTRVPGKPQPAADGAALGVAGRPERISFSITRDPYSILVCRTTQPG